MHPLRDAQRRRLLDWAALLCAIPLCLAPLAGRSSFELAGERAAFDARFSAPQQGVPKYTPVTVARDPFVPEAPAPAIGDQEQTARAGVVGMHVMQGDPMGFLLPVNRADAGAPLVNGPAAIITVTAIVSGSSPRALVDEGDRVRVVGIGDMLGGARVLGIDESGVRLQNGTLLALTESRL